MLCKGSSCSLFVWRALQACLLLQLELKLFVHLRLCLREPPWQGQMMRRMLMFLRMRVRSPKAALQLRTRCWRVFLSLPRQLRIQGPDQGQTYGFAGSAKQTPTCGKAGAATRGETRIFRICFFFFASLFRESFWTPVFIAQPRPPVLPAYRELGLQWKGEKGHWEGE